MTDISDEAISDFDDAEATARVIGLRQGLRGWALRQHEVRAGLAAALPHLAAACDALRAAEAAPTQSRQPTPERRPTAATGALNDVSQRNPNPTDTTQED